MAASTHKRITQKHRFIRTVGALILREMATTYGRSPGGYIWAFLEPVAGITLLSVVFSIAFSTPPLGENFALFYASGFLPFFYYTEVSQKLSAAIRYSRPLLFYPSVTYWDALFARFLLTLLTSSVTICLVIGGIIVLDGNQPNLRPLHLANAFGMASALGFGVGILNCYLSMTFPTWEHIWSILNKPLFIISGVLFLFDSVPIPFDTFLFFNPLIHIIGEVRAGIYDYYSGNYVNSMFVYGAAFTMITVGLLLLNRFNKEILSNG